VRFFQPLALSSMKPMRCRPAIRQLASTPMRPAIARWLWPCQLL
jgi:hypothetical protein